MSKIDIFWTIVAVVAVAFLLVFLVVLLATNCEAAELPWQGAQYQFFASGSVPLSESTDFRGLVAYLTIPSAELDQWFSYFGPTFNLAKWLWLAPQVGAVSGWSEDGEDGPLFSLWSRLSFLDEDGEGLTAFFEGDVYFFPDVRDYYSFASCDWNFLGLNLGIHVEGINELFMYGPHLGFSKGLWHGEVQYFVSMEEENQGQAVRFVTAVEF